MSEVKAKNVLPHVCNVAPNKLFTPASDSFAVFVFLMTHFKNEKQQQQ